MTNIPLHLLADRTNLGLYLKYFKKGEVVVDDEAILSAHRDDHYMFFLLENGSGSVMIDFIDMPLPEHSLYYILPTQVHQRIKNYAADGWVIAVDTALIPPECRTVFESTLILQQPHVLNAAYLQQFRDLLALLFVKYMEDNAGPFYILAIHSLLQSFFAIAATCYNGDADMNLKVSRPVQLKSQFKDLLTTEIRTVKSPAAFAAKLNVSEAYLSEILKKTTGFPPSYWIQQEVIMEAKRLLYYSDLTVKEIAHTLGYTDHSYFSRLFSKITGTSAIAFRDQYRK
ncbi:AraC-type DNA-binding protein [Mucilaginibacter lappiensis]|uniref:AraC-like DNA-binding protein n=1 Tax=Mucilaginibacter lappiensis TaxID=354630 RepID=A0ABR6PD48_9SPHI|nr:helix-turn-helix domain-containing protein [Mucilaginibacter lappiensis]MBB6107664.1 AraC-like DNA-binding protein [Mucilaginibacter lappiensis]SIQ01201.1 AraC-type DNA-binding protein [Mucilaginibacter lappiensis]